MNAAASGTVNVTEPSPLCLKYAPSGDSAFTRFLSLRPPIFAPYFDGGS
jgi:hypothetical protein